MTRTRLTAAAVALVLLAAAGCGGDPAVVADPPAPAPVTPTPAAMTEADACRKASLLVGDATGIVTKLAAKPDASTINTIELQQLIMEMKAVVPHMPEGLGEDLVDLIGPLEDLSQVISSGRNQSIDTGIYASRGPGIIMACGRYV